MIKAKIADAEKVKKRLDEIEEQVIINEEKIEQIKRKIDH